MLKEFHYTKLAYLLAGFCRYQFNKVVEIPVAIWDEEDNCKECKVTITKTGEKSAKIEFSSPDGTELLGECVADKDSCLSFDHFLYPRLWELMESKMANEYNWCFAEGYEYKQV